MQAAPSIIVVHGVGDQVKGETARSVVTALAQQIITENRPERVDVSGPNEVHIPTSGYAPCSAVLQTMQWSDPAHNAHQLPVYEFYWADASRNQVGIADQFWLMWQLAVGLPRIGLRAIDGDGHLGSRIARMLCGLVWLALVAHLITSVFFLVATTVGSAAGYPLVFARIATLWSIELLFNAACILLAIALAAVAIRRRRVSCMLVPLLTLGTAWLLTHIVPLAVEEVLKAWYPTLTPASGAAANGDIWSITIFGRDINLTWFYAINSLAGFWPYVSLSFAILLVCTIALGYLVIRLAPSAFPEGVDWLLRIMAVGGGLLVVSILIFGPLLDMYTLYRLASGGTPPYVARSVDKDDSDALTAYGQSVLFPFSAIVVVFFLSSEWKPLLSPPVELALDVVNYLPPRPWLDRFPPVRYMLAGRRPPSDGSLEQELSNKLAALVKFAQERHGDYVIVVAHSLGSMIALSSIRSNTIPSATLRLVTMGSPLHLFSSAFPQFYSSAGGDRESWKLPSISIWINLFRSGDVIGRQLKPLPFQSGSATCSDTRLGPGGHADYFKESRTMHYLLKLL